MEFNKIAGAIILSLLIVMGIAKIGNTLVPPHYPAKDKPGTEAGPTTPEVTEPEKPVAELLATADPKAGETRAKDCVSCHTFDKAGKNGVGPNLWDIVGRKKGGHAGFAYSDGLKNAGGEWTYEDIFKYLHNPAAMIPGSKMAFRLTSGERRAQVIAYLRTLSDSPKPLPVVEKKTETPKPEPQKTEEKKTEPPKAEPGKSEPEKPATPATPAPAAPATPATPATPAPATPPAEEKKN